MKHILISLIILIFSIALLGKVSAEEGNLFQRDPARIHCLDQVKRCTYVVQNLPNARILVSRLNAILFPGTILDPDEGYLEVEGLKKLSFWLENEEIRGRFMALIPLLDVYEDFNASNMVQVSVEIFSLSEGAMKNLDASLSSARDAGADDNWSITTGNGAADLALKVGTSFLSSVLGSRRVKENTTRMTKVTQLVTNFGAISYNHTTKIFVSPTAGVVKEETAGLSISGSVSINAQNPEQVIIKDFNFSYGVLAPADSDDGAAIDRVSMLNFSRDELMLDKGLSNMLVSSVSSEMGGNTSLGILSYGSQRNKLQTKMMVVVRAKTISYDEYVQSLRRERDRTSLHREFTSAQVNAMPTDSVDNQTIYKSIRPYAYFTTAGDRLVGFKLDKSLARADNIKKHVEVSVRGGGLKMKKVLSLENLMLSGLKFDAFDFDSLSKPYIKLKVSIRPFRSGVFSSERVKHKLYYNPESNKFIQK